MPTSKREQSHAIAARWAAWLNETARKRGKRQIDIVRASDGSLPSGTVARWFQGDNTAAPRQAIIVARILGEPADLALRMAGHTELAEEMLAEAARIARATDPRGPQPPQTGAHAPDARLQQIRESALPPGAQKVAEEYLAHQDATTAEGLARYIKYLQDGERILDTRGTEPNGGDANAS